MLIYETFIAASSSFKIGLLWGVAGVLLSAEVERFIMTKKIFMPTTFPSPDVLSGRVAIVS